jgi:ribonucleoside-diphosphate reductase alpha chain
LPPDLYQAIAAHGIRNSLLTSIAPTGTISLFAGNVSSGIEPVFAFSYKRKVLQPDGSKREEMVSDYAVRVFQQKFGADAALPDYFVNAQTLSPRIIWRCRPPPSLSSTAPFPRPSMSGGDFLRGFQPCLSGSLCPGLQGLHHLSPQCGDGIGAVGGRTKCGATRLESEPELPLPAPEPRMPAEKGGVVYMTRPLDRPDA